MALATERSLPDDLLGEVLARAAEVPPGRLEIDVDGGRRTFAERGGIELTPTTTNVRMPNCVDEIPKVRASCEVAAVFDDQRHLIPFRV